MNVRVAATSTVVVTGSAVLAVKPLLWLTATWYAPGYDSIGWVVLVLTTATFLWSATSGRLDEDGAGARSALGLLLSAAAVRLVAQLLAVNLIGALTLAADVYALAVLAGLARRRRAVSPFWLAVVFCFSLPLEPALQRLLGYPLQQWSAVGACSLLQLAFDGVSCDGMRILVGGRNVLVDLPCSGAQLLSNALLAFAFLAAMKRPRPQAAVLGASIAVLAAWIGNSLRIAALAAGTAFPETVGGVDLTAQPWHDLTGLLFTAMTAVAVAWWSLRVRPQLPKTGTARAMRALPVRWHGLAGVAYAGAAVTIVSLTPRPLDVSAPVHLPPLPLTLAGSQRVDEPLSFQEQRYFGLFGGTAERASYGPFALLVSGTRSPLRHLHGPEVCLEGAGHQVRYLGPGSDPLPTAVYRSRDPHGGDWRVEVSWISGDGHAAASVSEAVWYWLTNSASNWTMVQRIAPWGADRPAAAAFEAGVLRALDLSSFERDSFNSQQGVAL